MEEQQPVTPKRKVGRPRKVKPEEVLVFAPVISDPENGEVFPCDPHDVGEEMLSQLNLMQWTISPEAQSDYQQPLPFSESLGKKSDALIFEPDFRDGNIVGVSLIPKDQPPLPFRKRPTQHDRVIAGRAKKRGLTIDEYIAWLGEQQVRSHNITRSN